MKILVFSSTPWNTDNSFGNTYSNIFEGIDNVDFANIYCSSGFPKNNVPCLYFQLDEKSLFKNLFNKNINTGRVVDDNEDSIILSDMESKRLNSLKKKRWRIFFWARRFLWYISRWKSNELKEFIKSFKPDIIFVPLYHSTYLNKLILFIKEFTGVKMVAYVSDDVYTLKRVSFSPFFWLDRLANRRMIKKVVDQCEHLYVISEIQKREYEKLLGIDCSILIKGADFSEKNRKSKEYLNTPLKIVYTGNIGAGRWKSLEMLANSIKIINKTKVKAELFIYTATPISKEMESALNIKDMVYLMDPVPSEEIPQIQMDADILVHVESINLKERLEVRHSFSTKLVDYFHRARCILAIGMPDVASIDYLIKNDAALVANDQETITSHLNNLTRNPDLISEYADKAWECGKRNHQIEDIQRNLYNDLKSLVEEDKNESITN